MHDVLRFAEFHCGSSRASAAKDDHGNPPPVSVEGRQEMQRSTVITGDSPGVAAPGYGVGWMVALPMCTTSSLLTN